MPGALASLLPAERAVPMLVMMRAKNVSARACAGLADFQMDSAARKEM